MTGSALNVDSGIFFSLFFFLEQKETPASRTHSLSGGGRPFFGGGAYLEWHLRRRGNSSGWVFGTSGCFWQKGNSEAKHLFLFLFLFFCMTQTNKQTTAVTHSLPVCLWDGQLSGLRCPWKVKAGQQVRRSLKPLIPLQTWYFYAWALA